MGAQTQSLAHTSTSAAAQPSRQQQNQPPRSAQQQPPKNPIASTLIEDDYPSLDFGAQPKSMFVTSSTQLPRQQPPPPLQRQPPQQQQPQKQQLPQRPPAQQQQEASNYTSLVQEFSSIEVSGQLSSIISPIMQTPQPVSAPLNQPTQSSASASTTGLPPGMGSPTGGAMSIIRKYNFYLNFSFQKCIIFVNMIFI
jgi:hypothetical protein